MYQVVASEGWFSLVCSGVPSLMEEGTCWHKDQPWLFAGGLSSLWCSEGTEAWVRLSEFNLLTWIAKSGTTDPVAAGRRYFYRFRDPKGQTLGIWLGFEVPSSLCWLHRERTHLCSKCKGKTTPRCSCVFGACRVAVSGLCFVQKMLGALIIRGWMDCRMQRGRWGLEPEVTVQNAMVLHQICTGWTLSWSWSFKHYCKPPESFTFKLIQSNLKKQHPYPTLGNFSVLVSLALFAIKVIWVIMNMLFELKHIVNWTHMHGNTTSWKMRCLIYDTLFLN